MTTEKLFNTKNLHPLSLILHVSRIHLPALLRLTVTDNEYE